MARLRSYYSKGLIEAGVDEVGRGCLAGPVVAAAVILPANFRHRLLNDSKMMSAKSRDILSAYIQKKAISYAIAEVDNEEIDKINDLNRNYRKNDPMSRLRTQALIEMITAQAKRNRP